MSGNVLFAMIARLKDGLPLSAATDHDPNRRVLESKKYAKILSRKAAHFPDRCSMFTGSHWLYVISSLGVCFITMCEESYPSVLAFCFLDELQREFISSYDNRKVDSVVRPYALIDFDRVIQKTKQRYNNTLTLSNRKKFSDMTLEVKLRPPYRISIEDLQSSSNANGHTPFHQVQTHQQSHHRNTAFHTVNIVDADPHEPKNFTRPFNTLDWMAKLLLVLSILCGTLNLSRIILVLTFGAKAYEPEEQVIVIKAMLTLLVSSLLCYRQAFTLWETVAKRSPREVAVCALIILCNLYLYHLYWRFLFTVAFHSLIAVAVTIKLRAGSFEWKLPHYTV
ncbi:vesicle-trafficking protein SEC22a-like [Diadema antillarum]|uniref:vesicle-trafficking protein SEC22a-like n=1 Tax=Diadema antillarum TaxID=105358 RepID=UPI003A8AF092